MIVSRQAEIYLCSHKLEGFFIPNKYRDIKMNFRYIFQKKNSYENNQFLTNGLSVAHLHKTKVTVTCIINTYIQKNKQSQVL